MMNIKRYLRNKGQNNKSTCTHSFKERRKFQSRNWYFRTDILFRKDQVDTIDDIKDIKMLKDELWIKRVSIEAEVIVLREN